MSSQKKSNIEQPQHMVIIGRHPVNDALISSSHYLEGGNLFLVSNSSMFFKHLQNLAYQVGIKVHLVKRAHLDALSGSKSHQGVALILDRPFLYSKLDSLLNLATRAGEHALLIMADHLQSPYNLGAVIRSAAAAGAQGLIMPRDRACPLTPAVAKTAAGALEILPVCRVTNLAIALQRCKEAGLWALAAIAHNALPPWKLDLSRSLILVIGSEQKGISQGLLKICDITVSLPLSSRIESLNVSVATGSLLFEIIRQRSIN